MTRADPAKRSTKINSQLGQIPLTSACTAERSNQRLSVVQLIWAHFEPIREFCDSSLLGSVRISGFTGKSNDWLTEFAQRLVLCCLTWSLSVIVNPILFISSSHELSLPLKQKPMSWWQKLRWNLPFHKMCLSEICTCSCNLVIQETSVKLVMWLSHTQLLCDDVTAENSQWCSYTETLTLGPSRPIRPGRPGLPWIPWDQNIHRNRTCTYHLTFWYTFSRFSRPELLCVNAYVSCAHVYPTILHAHTNQTK